MDKEGIKLKCRRCKNVWVYRGKNDYYATCTRCLIKVNVRSCRVE